MQSFVFEANIAHFKKLLESEADPERRGRIERLLAEEEAKLMAHNAKRLDNDKKGALAQRLD
jgi:hypothetical protein